MPRLPLFLFPGVSLLLFSAVAMEEGNWFPLQPVRDDFQPNILDVSRFVEAPTGKHGFLAVKGDQFVFQDGTPARFWGSQVNAMGKEQVDYMVRRMRRQGINITRLHGLESLNDRNGKTSSDYDAASWDRMDYLIYKLGENGIYIILDTDYPLNYRFKPGDEIPGMPEGGPAPYAEFFDAKVASVLQRRMAEILTHVNPYTKKRYCDDPTVAMVEVLNEDSLFWGEVPQRYHDRIEGMFKAWMKTRRGEEAAAKATWQTNRNLLFQQLQANPEKLAMAQDQLRFMEGLEEKYWTGSRDVMRKAGLKVPVAATNWQGHGSPTTRVHMLGQSKVDYIDRHGYWDHPQGEGNLRWNIATAQFHNLPMVKDVKADQDHLVYLGVENLVTEKAWEQVLGMPMTISEWNTCLPNEYSLEGTGLMAAYGLLQGWDGSLEFGYFSPDFRDALGSGSFDLFGNPPQILQFPAAATMWHRRDVKEADVVAESLYDPASVYEATEDRKPVAAALVGKVGYRFVDKRRAPVAKDISKYWDPKTLTARSITGELTWNASDGVVTIDTPRTQAVIGFLSAGRHALQAVNIQSPNRFGAIWVTAMDDREPVRSARHVLITATGPARNTGMEYEKTTAASRLGALWHLTKAGAAPALLEAITGEVEIRSSRARQMKAWTLDITGKRVSPVDLAMRGDRVVLSMKPEHKAVYYELSIQ
jgi:hypothetical protein